MNPLGQGFYTVSEAARLIEVGNLARIRAWLGGYPQSRSGPLLSRDYSPAVSKKPIHELSFYDLIEVRFVEFFREHGVKVGTLRKGLKVAREVFNTDKPFATNRVRFTVSKDKREIIVSESDMRIATKDDDPKFWNLLTRQYQIVEITYDLIESGVTFDTETHAARNWRPRATRFPLVIIDPKIAYGRPVVGKGTPTQVIYETFLAEDQDVGAVMDWFELSLAEVQAAVGFERNLQERRTGIAA